MFLHCDITAVIATQSVVNVVVRRWFRLLSCTRLETAMQWVINLRATCLTLKIKLSGKPRTV